MNQDMLLILNFGGNQAQALARRMRRGQVFCEILPAGASCEEIAARSPRGILMTGTNESGRPENEAVCDPAVYGMGLPVLALGSAARSMARQLGGCVKQTALENQTLQIHFSAASPLLSGLSYADRLIERLDGMELPSEFSVIAHGRGLAVGFACEEKKLYGLQFDVESNDFDGLQILSNFADMCGCERWWTTENFVESQLQTIRETVGGGHALIALSGGVDSSVCAALMHRAIGRQMHCLYIDTGLMRKGDTRVVREMFGERLGIDIRCVNARDRFFARLRHLTDPAEKWAAISDEFRTIYEEEAARFDNVEFLVKGTIYSDVLNFSQDEQNLNELHGYKLIEPTRWLFKNEVRAVGEYLGLAPEITNRQPLPGSGLASRMTGELTMEKLTLLREADYILREEVEQAGLDARVRRCCAQLAESTSTGEHRCRYIIALRAFAQGSTDSCCRMPYDLLERVAGRILSELPLVDRVVYDLTPHPPRPREWE